MRRISGFVALLILILLSFSFFAACNHPTGSSTMASDDDSLDDDDIIDDDNDDDTGDDDTETSTTTTTVSTTTTSVPTTSSTTTSLTTTTVSTTTTSTTTIPVTIYDIQQGTIPYGRIVTIYNVVATTGLNLDGVGFFVQERPHEGSEYNYPYSGIYILMNFLARYPVIEQGDVLNITGQIAEIENMTELATSDDSSIVKISSGADLPPAYLGAASFFGGWEEESPEPYEGVLVKVEDVVVDSVTPSEGAYKISQIKKTHAGQVGVDDWFYELGASIGDVYTEIEGPLMQTADSGGHADYRILPRAQSDAVAGIICYLDFDRDGYGNIHINQILSGDACPDGWVDNHGDCNDFNPNIHPGAYDICGDNIDNNCDGIVDNPDDVYVQVPEFMLGISPGSGDPTVYLPQLGISWYRMTLSWNLVQTEVTDPELTMQDLEEHPELIDQFIDSIDWTSMDNQVRRLLNAGLKVLPVVGHGYTSTLPFIDGDRATPDRLGRDHYLAQQYRQVRAIVERYDGDGYKDADGIVIKYWQTENELNQAMLTAAWGWRDPSWLAALTSSWASWGFLTDLISTLYQAVHDADPEAVTVQNLHTDIHPNISHAMLQPSWIEAATLWRDYMDLIGYDAYPNYYMADPVLGTVVGERAQTLLEAGCGKPVIVMETAYPTGPEELGYTWDSQAQFIDDAFHTAYAAGVVGYFSFGLVSNDSHSVVITPEDIANLQYISGPFTEGQILPLLFWGITHLDYINQHFIDVLQAVEGYWGVIRSDGVYKPGFYTLQDIAGEINGP